MSQRRTRALAALSALSIGAVVCAAILVIGVVGPRSRAIAATTPAVAAGSQHHTPPGAAYTPLTPTRLADTRTGWTATDGRLTGTGPLGAGRTLEIPIAGRYGVPTDAPAAVLNTTIVGPQADGYATIYP